MVRQYYVDPVTELSNQELNSVINAAEPPVCLLGGWAVHLHVNKKFEEEHGRGYIGSRDIDLGINVDPDMNAEELQRDTVGETISNIQDLGYTESRFGFVQHFLRDTREPISEKEAENHPIHKVFKLYIDIIPDTDELDQFKEAFGFRPPTDPMLKPVFQQKEPEPLDEYVPWQIDEAVIVPPELLAAMKIRSLSDRDKSHKQVKDAADLHALLWYTKDYNQISSETLSWVSDEDIERLEEAFSTELAEEAATLLQTDPATLEESINRLFRQ